MKLLEKIKSDKGAVNSVEMIMLIALAFLMIMAVREFIIVPMIETSGGIGAEIDAMNPRP